MSTKSLPLLLLWLLSISEAHPALRVWVGSGTDGNWSTPANWFGNGVPQPGDDIVFPDAASRLANIANMPNLPLNSIRFTGGGYSITGNPLVVSNGIVFDPPAASSSVALAVALSFPRSQTVQAARGDFTLSGNLQFQSVVGTTNEVVFRASAGARIIVSGVVTGTNNVLATGGGDVRFDAFGGSDFRGKLRTVAGRAIVEGQHSVGNTVDLEIGPGGIVEFSPSQANGAFRFSRVRLEENSQLLMNQVQLITAQVTLFGNSLIDGDKFHFHTPGFHQIDFSILQGLFPPNGFIVRASSGPAVIRDTEVGFGSSPAYFDVSGSAVPGLNFDASIEGAIDFEKYGNGYLRLSSSNSFGGRTVLLNEGTVEIRDRLAFGERSPAFTLREIVLTNSGALVLRDVVPPSDHHLFVHGNAPLPGGGTGSSLIAFGNSEWPGPVRLDTNLFLFADNCTLSGPIAGAGGIYCQFGAVHLAGNSPNAFTGPLTADCERLDLNKPSGVKAYAGPLVVGRPGGSAPSEVRWLNAYQNVGATLTLHANAVVNLNGFNEDFGPVTFNGGRVETGVGQFAIYQPVTVNASSAGSVINGFLGLPPGLRVFVVEDGPTECDLLINAVIFGSATHLVKRGPGTMCLTGANTYTALTLIEEGVLSVSSAAGLGATSSSTIVQDAATLWLNFSGGIFNEPISVRGAGYGGTSGALRVSGNIEIKSQFPAIFSAMELTTNAAIRVDSGQLTITGELRGNGPLTKTGPGTLAFGGSQANTYTGDTIINQGALFLNKPSGVTAVPGHLILGPGVTARHFGGFTIIGSVTVNRGGLWDLNGFSEGFGIADLQGRPPLTLNGGGDVQTGAGALYLPVGGDVVVNPGSLIGFTSVVSGNLGLDPGPHRFIVGSGINIIGLDFPELEVSAVISQTSTAADIVKEGNGELRLSAGNSFSGSVTANGGRVTAAHSFALGTTAAGSFVNNNASLALDGAITVGYEPLTLNTTNAAALISLGAVTNFWRGDIALQRTAGISVPESGGVLRFESFFGCCPSFITGPGGLTKSGPGGVVITGTIANNYAGPTAINDGLLEASRTQGPALSSNVVVSGPNSILRTGRSPAIKALPTAASMTVQGGALWTMNTANTEMLSRLQGDGRLEIGSGGALTVSNSVSCEFSGPTSGSGALNKLGLATLRLTGNSAGYTGLATVFEGTYKVDGDFHGSPTMLKPAAILRGGGSLGDVTVEPGGVVRVDDTWSGILGGSLAMGSVNFQSSGSRLNLELFGPLTTGGNDSLYINGPVTLGNVNLNAAFGYPPHEGDVITLISKVPAGAVSGIISGFPEGAVQTIGSIPVVTSYVGGDGNDVTLTVTNLPLRSGGMELVASRGGSALVPNDCSQLWLGVTNRSTTAMTGLHGKLRSLTPGVVVTRAESAYPDLALNARGTNGQPFQIRTEPSFPCGGRVQFELILTAANFPPTAIVYTMSGTLGSALSFDGRDDFVQFPTNAFAAVSNNFTIELWANPTGSRTQTPETNFGVSGVSVPLRQVQRFAVFPDRGDLSYGANHVGAGLSIGNNGISVYEYAANFLPSRLVYSNALSGWTHVALVYASRRPRLYVNGVLVRSGSTSAATFVHASANLGGSIHGDFGDYRGQLDEVRIWNVALSEAEIQTSMSRSLTGTEPGLATYFRCDEGEGISLADSAPASPNRNGALTDNTAFVFPGAVPMNLPADCNSGGGACESCHLVRGQFTTNALESVRRIAATARPSICDPPSSCPGVQEFPDAPVRHVLHFYTNRTATELCVTAQLRLECPDVPAGSFGVAAYLGEFLIDQPCSNYLGDDGAAEATPPPFSFRVPPRTNFLLVMTERVSNPLCDRYTLELFGLPCPPPRLDIAHDTTPGSVRLSWSSAYPDFGLQSVNSFNGPGPHGFGNIPTPPVLVGGKFAVTNGITAPRQFFRLTK